MVDYANNNHRNKIEEILQYISREFITVRRKDGHHVNIVLKNVVQTLVTDLKELSLLFSYLYEEPYYGGSYYSGLKIKKPDEFDIDLKLRIPDFVNPKLFPDEYTGFVEIMLQDIHNLDGMNSNVARELIQIVDEENYIVQNKTVSWIYGLICQSLNRLNNYGGCFISGITQKYNGPAVCLTINYCGCIFSIDLVLSFVFTEKYWPAPPFRSLEGFEKTSFLTVPKKPKCCSPPQNRFFRFSFQEQENELLLSTDHGKPVFRLLKKLRDTRAHFVSSYVLKTMFLWEVEKRKNQKNEDYWCQPMNVIFYDMLEIYKKYMLDHDVPYFWNKHENLIFYTKEETTNNVANFLQRMIRTIDSNIDEDIYIFAKFLLLEDEYRQLIHHFRGTPCECSRDDDILYQKVQSSINYDG